MNEVKKNYGRGVLSSRIPCGTVVPVLFMRRGLLKLVRPLRREVSDRG